MTGKRYEIKLFLESFEKMDSKMKAMNESLIQQVESKYFL